MDRKLTVGAIALLIIQIFLLISDFSFMSLKGTRSSDYVTQKIGLVESKREFLKKRNQGSVVWEDSYVSDNLLSYDSLLTLDNSTAQLELKNDIHINLQENTLVVLEPPDDHTDDQLRIRFGYGDFIASSLQDKFQIGAGEWRLEAQPGTNMSLKSLAGDQLEVEITKGELHLTNKSDPTQTKSITEGNRFTLDEKNVSSDLQISDSIQIDGSNSRIIYSHLFPVPHIIRWGGAPTAIRIVDAQKKIKFIDLNKELQNYSFNFNPGTYFISLQNEKYVSREIIIRVLKAPIIRYTSPLFRQRLESDQPIVFSWVPVEVITKYKLELTNSLTEKEIWESPKNSIQVTPKSNGEIYMRVSGQDSKGNKIPSYYSQPLFVEDGLLAAPKLLNAVPISLNRSPRELKDSPRTPSGTGRQDLKDNTESRPTIVAPQNDDPGEQPKSKDSSNGASLKRMLDWVVSVILPRADAQIESNNNGPPIEFNWLPVKGADFYTIEISADADFMQTEFISRVFDTKFIWARYLNGTYYWRVAGGTHTGRLGIFSEPAFIDLRKTAGIDPNSNIGPGVKILPTKDVMTLYTSKPVEAYQKLIQSQESIQKKQEEKPSSESKQKEDSSHISTWVQYHMTYSNYSFEKDFKTAVSGFGILSLAAGANIKWGGSHAIVSSLRYEHLPWQASDENALPYQGKLDTQEISFQSLYGQKWSDLQFGVLAENLNIPERDGLETIRAKSVYQFGFILGYGLPVTQRVNIISSGGIVSGGSITAVRSFNSMNYSFDKTYVGADFDFKIYFGTDSLSGFNFKSGVHIGRSW